jgi:hypothetical protein
MSKQTSQEQASFTATPVKPVETARPTNASSKSKSFQGLPFLFDKQNYMWMAIGLVVIIAGYALMSGGRSADPNVFDGDSLYSFTRITVAPIMIILGLVIEGYAIMKKPSTNA